MSENSNEDRYLALMGYVLSCGEFAEDRTGVGTWRSFGHQLEFDMREGFPAVTTKKLAWLPVKGELTCFLEGATDWKEFDSIGAGGIWKGNLNAPYWTNGISDTDLGVIYGAQARGFGLTWHTDQLKNLVNNIRTNPTSRRLRVTHENVADYHEMCLPPCHVNYQVFCTANGHMDLKWEQRSWDLFLGAPFNIASYALLLHILAKATGYKPRRLIVSAGDCHIYANHVSQVKEQLQRKCYGAPILELPDSIYPGMDLIDYIDRGGMREELDQFKLVGYKSHPTIKAKMAV